MSLRSKLEEIAVPADLFPNLSPIRKAWNRLIVWLYTKGRK